MQARMTYTTAVEQLGGRARRKVANNTYLERRDDETVALRLHATDVVTFRPGTITLDTGGWRTVTTKNRINYALPVFSDKGTWYVGDYRDGTRHVYADGITFTEAGSLVGDEAVDPTDEAAAMKKRITAFVKLAGETFEAGMPTPSTGDCWYCMMRTETGRTLGDWAAGDHDHLLGHMDEGYVVPSLLVNAVVEAGYNVPAFILGTSVEGTTMGGRTGGHYGHTDLVKRSVRKYLTRRLVPTQTGARPTAAVAS
jgi:hypothetical protein